MTVPNEPKPFVIPVFIPHAGCPHQCVFCNQSTVTGKAVQSVDRDAIKAVVDEYLSFKPPWRKPVQISFYGGTFLGMAEEVIRGSLEVATEYIDKGVADSIRFSTRPDSVDQRRLDLIRPYPVSTIELGVQSMNDTVLKLCNRGHTSKDTEHGMSLLKASGYETGIQIMTGLPGDTPKTLVSTARQVIALSPDFVRIYPSVVLKDSPMEAMYQRGRYQPMGLDESVATVARLYLMFLKQGIPVVRMGLQATDTCCSGEGIVAGPYHPSFGHMVYSAIFLDMVRQCIQVNPKLLLERALSVAVHSKNISVMRGLKNINITVLKKEFDVDVVAITGDDAVPSDGIVIKNCSFRMNALRAKLT